jgi:predicted RNA binding protein YcfA (HicA-like mRNA interferase family)
MSRLRIIKFRVMKALLLKLGFEEIRQNGSHVFFRHNDGRTTTVPDHGNRDLARPLIRSILQDIRLSPDEYERELAEL